MEGRSKGDGWRAGHFSTVGQGRKAALWRLQPLSLFLQPVSFPSALSEDGKQLALPSKPNGPLGPRPSLLLAQDSLYENKIPWPCKGAKRTGARTGHKDWLSPPPSRPYPAGPPEQGSPHDTARRVRGPCCLRCCYAGPATGSSEVGLWSGVGLGLGSRGRPPQPGLQLQAGNAK